MFLPGLLCDASIFAAQRTALEPHLAVAVADFSQADSLADMARAALADAATSGAQLIVTDAPDCLIHLRANAAGQATMVRGLYELLADRLDD